MKQRHVIGSGTVVLALAPWILAAGQPQPLALSFQADKVVATGITPGGTAVFFSVGIERPSWHLRVVPRLAAVRDTKGDGSVTFDLATPLAGDSIWAAGDVATAGYAISTPRESLWRPLDLDPSVFESGATALRITRYGARLRHAYILLMRSGVGAWQIDSRDGGNGDLDRTQNGSQQIALASLRPVADSPNPPLALADGDTIVVFESDDLWYGAVSVGKK